MNNYSGGLLGLVVLILDIIAIADILQSGRSLGSKVLWMLLILLLPVVGMIIYYLVGRKGPIVQ